MEALKEEDFVIITDEFTALLEQKHSRLLSSQIAEDFFNRQKRLKYMASNRRLNVAAAWKVLQTKNKSYPACAIMWTLLPGQWSQAGFLGYQKIRLKSKLKAPTLFPR